MQIQKNQLQITNFPNYNDFIDEKLQLAKLSKCSVTTKFNTNHQCLTKSVQFLNSAVMESISHVQKDSLEESSRSQKQQKLSSQNSVDVQQIADYDESSRVLMKNGRFKRFRFTWKHLLIAVGLFVVLTACVFYGFHDDIVETIDNYLNDQEAQQIYDLIKLNSTSALCLDGSPASYYVSRTGDPSKILIYFQGGGWSCGQDENNTLKQCFQRSKTDIGSSANLPWTKNVTKGILARDKKDYFKDWKKIHFNYCDGSGHQGYRKQAVEYMNTKLYFRGHNSTMEKFEDLQKRLGLFTKATHVVLTGSSAGGLATYTWTNYLANKLQKAQFYSVPDSGLFYDAISKKTGNYSYKQCLANLMKFSNDQIDPPNPECMKEFPDSKVNCMFAQNLYQHIKVPLYPAQSLYDSWSISYILDLDCISHGISTCSQEDRNLIEDNRRNVTDVLRRIGKNPKNGVYGLGCVWHGLLDNPAYMLRKIAIPGYSQWEPGVALGAWMQSPDKDNVRIDYDPWPGNKPCS